MIQMIDNQAEVQATFEPFRRLVDEGFNGGDTAVVDEVCAEDLAEHQAGLEPPGRDGVKGAIKFLHTLAPDIRVTIEDFAVAGDRVWARLRGRGTHGGTILGGPTGRAFDITIMDVVRTREGKIIEHWGVADRLSQMQQLGVLGSRRGQ